MKLLKDVGDLGNLSILIASHMGSKLGLLLNQYEIVQPQTIPLILPSKNSATTTRSVDLSISPCIIQLLANSDVVDFLKKSVRGGISLSLKYIYSIIFYLIDFYLYWYKRV